MGTLVIRNPEGQKLALASNLANYLQTRPRVPKFRFGHWLRLLSNAEIDLIGNVIQDLMRSDGQPSEVDQLMHDDVVMLLPLAMAAETGKPTMNMSDNDIDAFRVAISLESLQRQGLLKLSAPVSLNLHEKIGIEVSPKAMEMGADFEKLMQAMLRGPGAS